MAEAVEDLEANQGEGGSKRILKDLFGGAVGGVAQVLIGMSMSPMALFMVNILVSDPLPFSSLIMQQQRPR